MPGAIHQLDDFFYDGEWWAHCVSDHNNWALGLSGLCEFNADSNSMPSYVREALIAAKHGTIKPEPKVEDFVKKVTKAPDPRPRATHRLCGGCGELFQPKSLKDLVCSSECEPIRQKEQEKLRAHAEKAARGIFD